MHPATEPTANQHDKHPAKLRDSEKPSTDNTSTSRNSWPTAWIAIHTKYRQQDGCMWGLIIMR